MFKSYFLVALRNMLKQKTLNMLNVLGLSIGMAAGLIIAIHIREELSYETSFNNFENIYRVHREGWAASSPALATEFHEFFHDIDAIGRFSPFGTRVVTTDRNNPGEAIGYYADSTIMKVFGLKVIDGDPTPLAATSTVVITRQMAKRFFGDESPVGKSLSFGNGPNTKILKFDDGRDMPVTAVIEDLPANSHLQFDYLVSMPTFYQDVNGGADRSRSWMIMYTYFRARPEVARRISERMPQFIRKYYADDDQVEQKVASRTWRLMPIKDIHLHSNLEKEMNDNSSMVYVYIFAAIELLILLVASANFMTLFTTQALKRVKEVGMRKVMGARPGQIMLQFLTDVSMLTSSSVLLAAIFFLLALPFYNELSTKPITAWQVLGWNTIGTIALIVIVVSGLYPAFVVSGFKVGSFLRESRLPRSLPARMQRAMVVFQFVVSVSLIAATFIVRQQMEMMKNKDLGFDKEQVVNVKLYGQLRERSVTDAGVFRNEFLRNPDILSVGRVGRLIGERVSVETVIPEGKRPEEDNLPDVRVIRADEGYLDVMNIRVIDGRNFSRQFNDSASYIINESAAKALGLSDPVNTVIDHPSRGRKGRIIGVISDYHFATFHSAIEPLVIEYEPSWSDNLVIRIRPGKTRETLNYIRQTIDKLAPNSLFIYQFLDDRIDALYRTEEAVSRIFQLFSILAVIIACLGLFGLSSYTIEMRTKEIGIRKVLGATATAIVTLLCSGILRLIAIGFFIAVPLSWFFMKKWLDNFSYKIEIEWWVFGLTGLVVMVIAVAAVSFRTVRAALANPVKALRSE